MDNQNKKAQNKRVREDIKNEDEPMFQLMQHNAQSRENVEYPKNKTD